MQWRNTAEQYGFLGKLLHWLVAVGIIAQYFLAEAAEESDGAAAEPFSAAGIHTALGITILVLAALRLAWRLIELPPERPPAMKGYEIAIARTTHVAFYILLFAIPLSGWALATASGDSLSFLGWFDLPQIQDGGLQAPDRGAARSSLQRPGRTGGAAHPCGAQASVHRSRQRASKHAALASTSPACVAGLRNPANEADCDAQDVDRPEDELVVAGQPLRKVNVEVVATICGVSRGNCGQRAASMVDKQYEHFDQN